MGKISDFIKKCLIYFIKTYQFFISPLFGNRCRFYPSCSDYAAEAFSTYGLLYSLYLTCYRLLRCHPWCQGGIDPLPERKKC